MSNFLKDYFHYTRTERNGLLILVLISITLLFTPKIILWFQPAKTADFSNYELEIKDFMALKDKPNATEPQVGELFRFNPNTATLEAFQQLGLPEKLAKTIVNYRNKGGRFFKKEDLRKIYGLEEADYQRLESYMFLDAPKKTWTDQTEKQTPDKPQTIELFEFDPNTISKQDLLRLGISERAAQIMMNFREKGGTFRKREDLSKIYGITTDDYERLFAYIKIKPEISEPLAKHNPPQKIPVAYEEPSPLKIEINTASPADWEKLHGIGPYFSKQICNYRGKLGGFYTISQIAETPRLPDSTFQKITPFLVLNATAKTINLNQADEQQLARHPYLKTGEAKAIINYRNQHGAFQSIDQLHEILALKKETLKKISPYLTVD